MCLTRYSKIPVMVSFLYMDIQEQAKHSPWAYLILWINIAKVSYHNHYDICSNTKKD